jgi:Ser/Thr protein kinase RdoA (MazF antagonist)
LLCSDDVLPVLQQFPVAAGACQAVNGDGFSGARLWRVTDGERRYCLRRWPTDTTRERVRSINAVLAAARLPFVPRPVITHSLDSVVAHNDHLWTLQPWMPGEALSKVPPPQGLLGNALQALALFHRATAMFRCGQDSKSEYPEVFSGPRRGLPRGLASRSELARNYWQNGLLGLKTAPIGPGLVDLVPRRERSIALFLEVAPRVLDESHSASQWHVPVQVCIRDIHAGHVLFTGDQVTGLIDFDAMRVDSVATDLARLLGSYCADNSELWDLGLNAYDEIRPLSKDERSLVLHYDRFAVLLTGLQWLQWILLEGKQFELARVLPRIDATLERLEHLRNRLRTGPGQSA